MKHALYAMLTLLSFAGAVHAGDPQAALSETASAPIPAIGTEMRLAQDRLIVGAGQGDATLLFSLDPVTLELLDQAQMPDSLLAMAARDDLDRVAILSLGGTGTVTLDMLDASLRPLASTILGPLENPALSLTAEGRVVISARAGGEYLQVIDADGKTRLPLPKIYEATQPLSGAWVSGGMAYFNAATEMRLSAVDLTSGISYSDYHTFFKDGRAIQPFAVAPLLADRVCRHPNPTEFIVADDERRVITLLRVNDATGSLIPTSEAMVAPREAHDPAAPGGMLVASSCNGAAIWVAARQGNSLTQLSAVREGDRLEQVGTARLAGPPVRMVLKWDGLSGWVLLRDQPVVTRFELIQAEPPPLPGDSSVREFQRLLSERGYPVGTIDGIIGERTRRAGSLLTHQTGVTLNFENTRGLEAAIETLRDMPPQKK